MHAYIYIYILIDSKWILFIYYIYNIIIIHMIVCHDDVSYIVYSVLMRPRRHEVLRLWRRVGEVSLSLLP